MHSLLQISHSRFFFFQGLFLLSSACRYTGTLWRDKVFCLNRKHILVPTTTDAIDTSILAVNDSLNQTIGLQHFILLLIPSCVKYSCISIIQMWKLMHEEVTLGRNTNSSESMTDLYSIIHDIYFSIKCVAQTPCLRRN